MGSSQQFAAEMLAEIDSLNEQLSNELAKEDKLFWKVGKTKEGYTCVCLSVDTSPITYESAKQYAGKIYQKCQELEKTSKIIEKIGELLRQGIQKAQEEISKEEEEAFWNQEGIMRQLPVVGSVLSWWLPQEKTQIPGRTFNLASKSLEKTIPQSPTKQDAKNKQDE